MDWRQVENMIISASRRTDIPAFYSDWFMERIREGNLCVRNPMNANQISKINLSSDVVDFIIFWSKNPEPMLSRLSELKGYPYYFQFTLNPYESDIETNLPPLSERIETFHRLSEIAGKERIVWRYDPVLINEKYTVAYHIRQFEKLAGELAGYAEKCMFSYLDFYSKIKTRMNKMGIRPITSLMRTTAGGRKSN